MTVRPVDEGQRTTRDAERGVQEAATRLVRRRTSEPLPAYTRIASCQPSLRFFRVGVPLATAALPKPLLDLLRSEPRLPDVWLHVLLLAGNYHQTALPHVCWPFSCETVDAMQVTARCLGRLYVGPAIHSARDTCNPVKTIYLQDDDNLSCEWAARTKRAAERGDPSTIVMHMKRTLPLHIKIARAAPMAPNHATSTFQTGHSACSGSTA